MPVTEPLTRTGDVLQFRPHPGQARAWRSTKRIPAVIAGTQWGKTVFGPPWLHREMTRCGPGDYLIASPTFKLMSLKVLPEVERFFVTHLQAGRLTGGTSPEFRFSEAGERRIFGAKGEQPSRILFGHAQDPDSLESATARAAWLDEAGQNAFKLGSWEAIQRRLAIHQGRALITTTPYNVGWLKTKIYDPWKEAKGDHPEIDVIQGKSTDNPAFPKEEDERARRELPGWKYRMFYRGEFDRPAGMVYDSFLPEHVLARYQIPPEWPRWVGLDFGPVNTAAVFFAEEMAPAHDGGPGGYKTGRLIAYREYHAGNRSSQEHVCALREGEPASLQAVGGAPRIEQGWRDAFRAAGLAVREPDLDRVAPGIDRVYAAFRANQLLIFSDLHGLLDELASYSYALDEKGEPTDELDDPHSYHRLDATRYIISHLKRPHSGFKMRC